MDTAIHFDAAAMRMRIHARGAHVVIATRNPHAPCVVIGFDPRMEFAQARRLHGLGQDLVTTAHGAKVEFSQPPVDAHAPPTKSIPLVCQHDAAVRIGDVFTKLSGQLTADARLGYTQARRNCKCP